MIICTYCGNRILDEDRRCVTCGAPAPVVKKKVFHGVVGIGGGKAVWDDAIKEVYAGGTVIPIPIADPYLEP